MYDYNQDYFVLVDDFSNENRMRYIMGAYGQLRATRLHIGPFNKPLEFTFDDRYWYKGFAPEDIIFDSYGLIFKDSLKQQLFDTLGQSDIIMHNIYFVSPEEEYFEGYWFIPTPEKPKEWLDTEASELKYRSSNPDQIRGIRSYRFNNHALEGIDENQRQLFRMPHENFGYTHHIAHKNVMNHLKLLDNRNFKFIPLTLFKSVMANEGPLPEFAF